MGHALTRAFVRLAAALAPRPDLACVLEAEPEAARARKPEYSLEFLRSSRESYRRLAQMPGMTMIPPVSIQQATKAVERAFIDAWQSRPGVGMRKELEISDPELPITR